MFELKLGTTYNSIKLKLRIIMDNFISILYFIHKDINLLDI